MKVLVGEEHRGPVVSGAIVVAAVGLLAFTVLTSSRVQVAAPVVALIVAAAVAYRTLLSWRSLLALTFLVILLIPIRRYSLPGGLPFHLEPYRLIVAFIALGWLTSLLIDRRVRLRRTPIDAPLFCFYFIALLSLVLNADRVASVDQDVIKKLMFFLSFVILYYLIASVARRESDLDFLVTVLAGLGAVVAASTIVESRTGYNVFNHLGGVVPFLHSVYVPAETVRGARLRTYASAQHPIALGAALVLLMPLALYKAYALRQRLWWIAVGLLLMGSLATVSRTAVMMLAVVILVYLLLRTAETKRLWPLLLPALIAVHIAMPGTIGTLKASLFPAGGLIAEQRNANVGSGRIATLGPALDSEWKPNPLLGEGFGTRVTKPDEYVKVANGPILDDQWLGIFLETGILGTATLVWLIARFLRRVGAAAKRDTSARGWLLTGLTASTAAYAVGMFTYDSFSFIQVTFLFFVLMGIGSALLSLPETEKADAPARARLTRRRSRSSASRRVITDP